MTEQTDEQLFERYRKGDNTALRALIDRHQADLLRFLYRLTGDRAAAEDTFQEAFLQVHLSQHTFDTTRRFKPWLFTIAANKGRDLLRKRSRRSELALDTPLSGGSGGGSGEGSATFVDLMAADLPDPAHRTDLEERDRMVQRALDHLSPTLREILLLAYFQRLSYAQVAEDLGIPLGTVKSRLHAAVAGFAKAWKAVSTPASEQSPGEGPAERETA